MFSTVRPFILYALSAVHAGSGSEIGVVDLPIQRERHTGYPKIESSSLKGALRASLTHDAPKEMVELVFGSEPKDERETTENTSGDSVAAAISLADARILLFPVRSLRGVFAWITCPHVLQRLNYELEIYKTGLPTLPVPPENTISSERLFVGGSQKVVLEEYTYSVEMDETTKMLAQRLETLLFAGTSIQNRLADRLIILPDDEFSEFVQLSTELNARVRIDSATGTVTDGGLWYEENLPPESVLYSFMFIGEPRRQLDNFTTVADVEQFVRSERYCPSVFQLGGNSSLGRGMLRRIWMEGDQ